MKEKSDLVLERDDAKDKINDLTLQISDLHIEVCHV